MKQFFISAILMLCSVSLFAQFEKGKNAAGLNMGLGYNNNGKTGRNVVSDRDYTIAPSLTYEHFIHRNLSLITGAELSLIHRYVVREYTNTNQQKYSETTIRNEQNISPLLGIKKYFMSENGKFGLFVSPYAMLNYQATSIHYTTNNPLTLPSANSSFRYYDNWLIAVNGNIGFCYFVRPNFSLELNSQVMTSNITSKYQRFWLGPNLGNIKYGVRYYF